MSAGAVSGEGNQPVYPPAVCEEEIRQRTDKGKQPRLWEIRSILFEIDQLRSFRDSLRADVNKLSVWLARIGVVVGETDGERIVAAVQRLNADVEYWRDEAAARGDEADRLQKIASRVQDWKEEHQAGQCHAPECLHMADLFDVLSEIGEGARKV